MDVVAVELRDLAVELRPHAGMATVNKLPTGRTNALDAIVSWR